MLVLKRKIGESIVRGELWNPRIAKKPVKRGAIHDAA